MSAAAARDVAGSTSPHAPERRPEVWLRESIGWLALEATRETYEAQPALWELGEHGRARTIEDFAHHLNAVAPGEVGHWRAHLRYTVTLFDQRGFPQHWLTDAFSTLDRVLAAALPEAVTARARELLALAPSLMDEIAEDEGIDLAKPTRYDTLR